MSCIPIRFRDESEALPLSPEDKERMVKYQASLPVTHTYGFKFLFVLGLRLGFGLGHCCDPTRRQTDADYHDDPRRSDINFIFRVGDFC